MLKKIVLLTLVAATAYSVQDSSKNSKQNGAVKQVETEVPAPFVWLSDAALELKKVPFFVLGRAKRNIESYATEKGVEQICMATVAEARTHFSKAKKS
jgi:light-independent protochlorophyllide reductase subunit B